MVKRILLVLVCACVTIPAYAKEQPLVISGLPNYAPVMWEQEGTLVGIAADLARLIFDELNVSYRFEVLPFKRAIQYAETGKVDVIAGIYKNKAREKFIAYSDPFMEDDGVLFVDNHKVFQCRKWENLLGKKGITNKGYSWGETFDQFIITARLDMTWVDTPEQAFALLLNKDRDMDYYLYGLMSGFLVAKRMQIDHRINALPNFITKENFYFGFSKKSQYAELLPKVNAIMQRLVDEQVVSKLIDKYIENYQMIISKPHH